MHATPHLVSLTVYLPIRDHRVFLSARRILVRIMGKKAPDTAALIGQHLSGRDATGVADEYLEMVGWPTAAGRAISVRRQTPGRKPVRVSVPKPAVGLDPARN